MSKILTIGLPTYNRAGKISKLLDFLYDEFNHLSKEECEKISLYISDNCSTDDTKDRILESKIVKEQIVDFEYTCNTENIGLLGNLKKIYTSSLGEYIWMMGDDDIYKPGIVKNVFDECEKEEYSYIFINHTIVKNRKVLQKSVLKDLDYKRTDQSMLLDLYFKSGTVMMFISACVYRTSLVKTYIQNHEINLVAPCSLSFYCASKGETKYIQHPMIIDIVDGISWSEHLFKVFRIQIPKMLLELPFWGYNFFKCYKRASRIYISNILYFIKKFLTNGFK